MRTSVQQAAANAFAAWLATKIPGVTIEPRWPSPDKKKPSKSISVVMAGRRRDTPIDLHQLKLTNVGAKEVDIVWQIAACTQPFQLDVWALTDVERDDLIARLDEVLHSDASALGTDPFANPVGGGCLIALADGWEATSTIADFVFDDPDTFDTSDTVGRSLYRASYRGNAHMMLTVTTRTARQVAINFLMRLSESDPAKAAPETTTITN